jgi:hypothetical protein
LARRAINPCILFSLSEGDDASLTRRRPFPLSASMLQKVDL